ncbi:MAG: hypothetical protein K1X82_09135 [Bacteroidia bacterium]|nr:hypothetical protein [Bacteroidia bacterium]
MKKINFSLFFLFLGTILWGLTIGIDIVNHNFFSSNTFTECESKFLDKAIFSGFISVGFLEIVCWGVVPLLLLSFMFYRNLHFILFLSIISSISYVVPLAFFNMRGFQLVEKIIIEKAPNSDNLALELGVLFNNAFFFTVTYVILSFISFILAYRKREIIVKELSVFFR